MTKDDALNRKAENARELGLSYDWTPKEDEAFNEVEKHSNLGKQILREMGQPYLFEKREWDELNLAEVKEAYNQHAKYQSEDMGASGWVEFADALQTILKEKNTWK